jgi:hypothetical protein
VIGEDGQKPGFVKALLRWLLWLVDGFPYIIPGLTGFIAALSTAGHRRVGDVVAKTFVVRSNAVGTPITIEDGGRLIVGDEAGTSAAPLGWGAPPPSPGAPTGWGPAIDPSTPPPPPAAAPPPPAPAPDAAPPSAPGVDAPQWDEARGTYIQWDPAQGAWMQWDEGFKAWIRIPGQ